MAFDHFKVLLPEIALSKAFANVRIIDMDVRNFRKLRDDLPLC